MEQIRPRWQRPLLWTSAGMAALAWVLFIVCQIRHPNPMLWIVTAGWPLYYGCVAGIGLGLLAIGRRDPEAARAPGPFGAFNNLAPRRLLNLFFTAGGAATLILFPFILLLMGVVLTFVPPTAKP